MNTNIPVQPGLSTVVYLIEEMSSLRFPPGDEESGKTALVAKLQGNDDPKKGSGLEYHFIDVKDEYRDGEISFGIPIQNIRQIIIYLIMLCM